MYNKSINKDGLVIMTVSFRWVGLYAGCHMLDLKMSINCDLYIINTSHKWTIILWLYFIKNAHICRRTLMKNEEILIAHGWLYLYNLCLIFLPRCLFTNAICLLTNFSQVSIGHWHARSLTCQSLSKPLIWHLCPYIQTLVLYLYRYI